MSHLNTILVNAAAWFTYLPTLSLFKSVEWLTLAGLLSLLTNVDRGSKVDFSISFICYFIIKVLVGDGECDFTYIMSEAAPYVL